MEHSCRCAPFSRGVLVSWGGLRAKWELGKTRRDEGAWDGRSSLRRKQMWEYHGRYSFHARGSAEGQCPGQTKTPMDIQPLAFSGAPPGL